METRPTSSNGLVEPSLADALARIAGSASIPPARRAHWSCSLRMIVKALGKSPDELPARWIAICRSVAELHHAPLGIEAKTLANHRSNVRGALAWFCEAADIPTRGAALSPAWAALRDQISLGLHRKGLLALMRFCSGLGLAPDTVDENVVNRFLTYRAEHTRSEAGLSARRALARAWDACAVTIPGWPATRLVEPPLPQQGIRSEDLTSGLRRDLEDHCAGLTRMRRNRRGKRLLPCKASTIRTRRAELMAYTAKAVACGFALEELTSFAELFRPDVVQAVLDAYWTANGATPTVYTIDLAWKALALARENGSFDEVALERLDEIRMELEHYRQPGLTEKNRAVIRQVLVDDVWRSVLDLPTLLLEKAVRQHNHAPIRAAVLAGVAVAIRILSFAPIRVGNLASIRIGENLIRPGGPKGPYWLVFPEHEVKNRTPLEFELDPDTSAMIARYLTQFRPALLRGAPNSWLFPGESSCHKDPKTLSAQITGQVLKATGVRMTAHQFRHAAAAIFLKYRPGEYELVRRLLGHRSIATTMGFYAGLETLQATRIFGNIVQAEISERARATICRPHPGRQAAGRAVSRKVCA